MDANTETAREAATKVPPEGGPALVRLPGNFAPVQEEHTTTDLPVTGQIPRELRGAYVRNGPNGPSDTTPNWYVGRGMLHGVRLEGGRAVEYRNRRLRGDIAPNTNVIRHGGRLLALVETSLPAEVTPELETVGPFDFGGALTRSMAAHPKTCPRTGELLLFSYGRELPHLTFHRADGAGRIVHTAPLRVPAFTFMHDFAITERYAVFFDLPVLVTEWRSPTPLVWADDYAPRIGVVPRDGQDRDARWFGVQPCMISHTVNAHEDGDRVVLDVARAPRLGVFPKLYRFTLDLRTGAVTEEELDEHFADFPRVSPRVEGGAYRYAYALELSAAAGGAPWTSRLRRYDVDARTCAVHDFGPHGVPGEPVFVPRADGAAEDDGWVFVFVYDERRDRSDLVILDAQRFADEPVATIHLPARVPFGFHGSWLPDLQS